jgi:serine phosphatase RsbU (regulator of sigma subunit)
MTERAGTIAGQPPAKLWRSLVKRSGLSHVFAKGAVADGPADPLHCDTPTLRGAEIAAVYLGERVAGDFYEFLRVGPSRMLFTLLDIAGRRADTREILIAVQGTLHARAPQLFAGDDFNETSAMIELCYEMNRTIMQKGVRACPAFIGCYNEDLGTLCYANSGHTPALLRDDAGISLLSATGLPLGLFSHTIQSANTYRLAERSALLLVSRGIVEATSLQAELQADIDEESVDGNDTDLGMGGIKKSFARVPPETARELCLAMLQAAKQSASTITQTTDLTTLALVRFADTT